MMCRSKPRPVFWFFGAAAGLYAVMLLDGSFGGHAWWEPERLPRFEPLSLFRSVVLIVISYFIVKGCVAFCTPEQRLWSGDQLRIRRQEWGLFSWEHSKTPTRSTWGIPVTQLVTILILGGAVACVMVMMHSPVYFYALSWENGFVENLSALLWFISALLTLGTLINMLECGRSPGRGSTIILIGLCTFSFLAMLEELSWFQHLLGIRPFGPFLNSATVEISIHAFFPERADSLFYSLAFVVLVMAPFCVEMQPGLRRLRAFQFFVPGRASQSAGLVVVCFNYDLWNAVHAQLALYISLFILVEQIGSSHPKRERWISMAILGVFLFCQVSWLMLGEQFWRVSNIREYKECFIALGFMVMSIEVGVRMKFFCNGDNRMSSLYS
ncbi:MAG: hypothetical protein HQL50_01715 [Magnetococcales bacterium]|nr:hypothetical protein [Magnetococcales bacterium]